ncbi:response regulator [Novispirillum sp. DQ9]|uniref:response regulator n=1 Tax=Novispirillum sp. DQ9 TaxID=3398612 RepID=UPI003C7B893A
MTRDDTPLAFRPEPVPGSGDDHAAEPASRQPWTVLVVDDEPEVHKVSWLVLEELRFRGRPLNLISAGSAAEARKALAEHPDTAVILLDVVMETEDAGLRLVREIRDEMRNQAVRIILRTGQPGQAPERRVVVDYDINDYKAKNELTADKLFTTVIAALRAYEDIRTIERFRENAFGQLGDQLGLMHDVVSMCPAPLAVLGVDGVVSTCSPAFARALGMEWRHLVGEPLAGLLPGFDRALAAAGEGRGEAVVDGIAVRLRRDAAGRPAGAVVRLEEDVA